MLKRVRLRVVSSVVINTYDDNDQWRKHKYEF